MSSVHARKCNERKECEKSVFCEREGRLSKIKWKKGERGRCKVKKDEELEEDIKEDEATGGRGKEHEDGDGKEKEFKKRRLNTKLQIVLDERRGGVGRVAGQYEGEK